MNICKIILNPRSIKRTANFMKIVCYLTIAFLVMMLVLSFMGRLEYQLSFGNKNYPTAIYAEENHNYSTRYLTVSPRDNLHVRTQSENGKIDLITYSVLTVLLAVNIIPLMFAYWFLSKSFANVSKGEIFVEKNAHYLLYYSIIQVIVSIFIPFVKLLIVQISNMLVSDRITLSTSTDILSHIIPSIALFVVAYIISYGVFLQDEVDRTL